MNKKCNQYLGNAIGIVLLPETPFKKGMSISTWEEKRAENAKLLFKNVQQNIENGKIIIINNKI